MESLIAESGNAYQGAAVAWARGPAVMYDRLASLAIAGFAEALRGARKVVDVVGAGTGALCRALRTKRERSRPRSTCPATCSASSATRQ